MSLWLCSLDNSRSGPLPGKALHPRWGGPCGSTRSPNEINCRAYFRGDYRLTVPECHAYATALSG
jgi:hypothetical protein